MTPMPQDSPHLADVRITLEIQREEQNARPPSPPTLVKRHPREWLFIVRVDDCHLETMRQRGLLEVREEGYVLTAEGAKLGYRLLEDHLNGRLEGARGGLVSRERPSWNRETGELKLGERLVRRVSWWARNLVAVLDAFEEAGWPESVPNPLPQRSKCYNQKIRDAVRGLNLDQGEARLEFELCEQGTHVRHRGE